MSPLSTPPPLRRNGWKSPGASPIALGLDLRGGVHFLLQVDVDFAEQKYLDGLAAAVREKLRADKVRYRSVKRERKRLAITLRDSSSKAKAIESLAEFAADLQPLESEVDSPILLLEITEEARDELAELALNQNLETLRNRVDELGVAEPVIARQGKDRIVAQLPGVQDTARAKAILAAPPLWNCGESTSAPAAVQPPSPPPASVRPPTLNYLNRATASRFCWSAKLWSQASTSPTPARALTTKAIPPCIFR